MSYQGDYAEDGIVDFKFPTRNTSGVPTTLAGTPALSVYKANGTTESTAGITLTVDFDTRTGLNHVRIDLSADAFYVAGEDYDVVITTGTVGTSVVGEVVGSFSIENRPASGAGGGGPGPILRKYGVETTLNFALRKPGGGLQDAAGYAVGDVKVMLDEAAEANATNGFTDEGQGYSIVVTAAQMSAARLVLYIVDQTAPKAWRDKVLIVETYGNASAQHAVDLDDAVRAGLTALPNAAADAALGLPISDAGGLDLDQIATDAAAAVADLANGTDGLTALAALITTVDGVVDGLAAQTAGITLLRHWLGAMAGKQAADATAQAEIRASGAGSGTYDPTTDSPEAIRDHVGDGTNLTEAGGTGDQFTALPEVDADVKKINAVTVNGDGAGTPWGP